MAGYDGNWWKTQNEEQRAEFVAGVLSCAGNHPHTPQPREERWLLLSPELTRFYQAHPDRMATPVFDLVLEHPAMAPSPPRGGQPSGGFDGDYWFQITPEGRRAFTEGYLVCAARHGSVALQQRPAGWYAEHVTAWYGIDDKTGVANEQRTTTTFPHALANAIKTP